jgi:hypothetical protein
MIARRTILARLRHALVAVAAIALPSTIRNAQAKGETAVDRQSMVDLFEKHVNAAASSTRC